MLAGHDEAMTLCDPCGNRARNPCKGHDEDCRKQQCETEAAEKEALKEGLMHTFAHGG